MGDGWGSEVPTRITRPITRITRPIDRIGNTYIFPKMFLPFFLLVFLILEA